VFATLGDGALGRAVAYQYRYLPSSSPVRRGLKSIPFESLSFKNNTETSAKTLYRKSGVYRTKNAVIEGFELNVDCAVRLKGMG
jgi:hypothetical protein